MEWIVWLALLAFALAWLRRSRVGRAPAVLARRRGLAALDWRQFEDLCADCFGHLGWQVEYSPDGADGGVDLIIRDADETHLVQCKHWPDRHVGVGPVRELFGVMCADEADGAIVVTSGGFTRQAMEFCEGKPIELIDGPGVMAMVG